MANDNTETKNKFMYIMNHMSQIEKVVWIFQIILPVAILIVALLGLNNIFPIRTTNSIDLVLLIILFILCGIKLVRERLVYAIIYFVLALLMCAILIASFLI